VALASELEARLRDFTAAVNVEVREPSGRAVPFAGLSWEIRGAAERPLLHLWSENYNVTRRVLAITDESDQRLALAVESFGRKKPERLEFVRVEFARSARDLSREEFCSRLQRILAEQFPDETLESLTVAADLEHSLSGNYARGILRRGMLRWAVLAVPAGQPADATENSLTFGLLWLERARQSSRGGTITGLRLLVGKGAGAAIAQRFPALHPQLTIELYEQDFASETLQRVDPAALGNMDSHLVPYREAQMLLDQARPALDAVLALSPQNLTVHPCVPAREVCLRFRGLAVATWKDGQIVFSTANGDQEPTTSSGARLRRWLKELEACRHPLASNARHILYRGQPERWLESIVTQDVTLIDASLDRRFVYTQVFTKSGGEHGILDLLCVTRSGRLAILELKANEHIHLPLQAAAYWLRIRRHLEEGDFSRLGYFPGITLQSAPPLVYLVAPALRFHPTTDTLLHCLSPQLEVIRVGITENWRRGLSVIMRQ
jgi:hypothetical protein